jgi:hypothetical protein
MACALAATVSGEPEIVSTAHPASSTNAVPYIEL